MGETFREVLPRKSKVLRFRTDGLANSGGKLSALREASLAREIREAGAEQMGCLYMGKYFFSSSDCLYVLTTK